MKRQTWLPTGCILTFLASPLFANGLDDVPLLAGSSFNPMGVMDDMFDSDDRRRRHRRPPPPPYYAPGYRYPRPPAYNAPPPAPYQGVAPFGQAPRSTPQNAASTAGAAYAPAPTAAVSGPAVPQGVYRNASGYRMQPSSPGTTSTQPIASPSSTGSSPSTSASPETTRQAPEPSQEAASSSHAAGPQFLINGKPAVFRPMELGTE